MRHTIPARLFALSSVLALVLGFCALRTTAPAQQAIGPLTGTFTSAASPPLRTCGLTGQNTATFQSTGAGPIDAQVSNDGASWTPATISTVGGAQQAQPFTPTSGTIYQITPLTADCVQIVPDSTWSGQTATITFKASTAIATVPTPGSGGGGGGSNVTIVAPTNAAGQVLTHDSTPVQPSPLYTSQVNTPAPYVAPTCPAVPNAPCVQLTGPPAPQPSPLYTTPVSCSTCPTPIPVPTATTLYPAHTLIRQGSSGATYTDTWADTLGASGNITSATTTTLISGVAGLRIYVAYLAFESSGTNSVLTLNATYSTVASCASSATKLKVTALAAAAPASGTSVGLWAGAQIASAVVGMIPATDLWIIPAGNNLCGVTAGTTIAGNFEWYAAQAP